jgi:signal transduction histidine kinase
VTLRNLVFRFGEAGQALAEVNARLAVTEAVAFERARLAREMHDSVAKTLHGLALTAEALAASADRADPEALKHQAALVASAARRAATESRHVLTDLRARTDTHAPTDLAAQLSAYAADFTTRTAIRTTLHLTAHPHCSPSAIHHLLAVTSEALENAHRHAHATHVHLTLEASEPGGLVLRIEDNGTGIPHPVSALSDLTHSGHFGLLGMAERARALGGELDITRPPRGGTRIELHAPAPFTPQKEAAHA